MRGFQRSELRQKQTEKCLFFLPSPSAVVASLVIAPGKATHPKTSTESLESQQGSSGAQSCTSCCGCCGCCCGCLRPHLGEFFHFDAPFKNRRGRVGIRANCGREIDAAGWGETRAEARSDLIPTCTRRALSRAHGVGSVHARHYAPHHKPRP